MRTSRSGRKFTRRGVKQKIKVGVLLRSVGYGSRIVEVMGKYKDRWVVRHFCNTAHFVRMYEFNEKMYPVTIDFKGQRQRDTEGMEFLTYPYGWYVVKEVKP